MPVRVGWVVNMPLEYKTFNYFTLVTFLYDNILDKPCDICKIMTKHLYNPRKLKIHTRYRAKKYGHVTIPEIRLVGHWLSKLGFEKGQEISIAEEPKRIVITLNE